MHLPPPPQPPPHTHWPPNPLIPYQLSGSRDQLPGRGRQGLMTHKYNTLTHTSKGRANTQYVYIHTYTPCMYVQFQCVYSIHTANAYLYTHRTRKGKNSGPHMYSDIILRVKYSHSNCILWHSVVDGVGGSESA